MKQKVLDKSRYVRASHWERFSEISENQFRTNVTYSLHLDRFYELGLNVSVLPKKETCSSSRNLADSDSFEARTFGEPFWSNRSISFWEIYARVVIFARF